MLYKVVAIRDRAIDAFGVPVFVVSLGGAIRSFGDEIGRSPSNGVPNNMFAHPDDFDLFHIGEYNDNTGELISIRPVQLAVGKDFAVKVG